MTEYHTSISAVQNVLRASFASGKTRSLEFRVQQLTQLFHCLNDSKDKIAAACYEDLRYAVLVANM